MPSHLNDGQVINDQCFACGSTHKLERAHILPICLGGNNDVQNIHLLCAYCHLESETLHGESYWKWYQYKLFDDFDFGFKRFKAYIKSGALLQEINEETIDDERFLEIKFLIDRLVRNGFTLEQIKAHISEQC